MSFPIHASPPAAMAERLPRSRGAGGGLAAEGGRPAEGVPLAGQEDGADPPGRGGAVCGLHQTLGRC